MRSQLESPAALQTPVAASSVIGITVGAVYAMVALGFTIIYNASDVVNFAQGEFVMLGGMSTVFLSAFGMPLPLAALLAIAIAALTGVALNKLVIEPARDALLDLLGDRDLDAVLDALAPYRFDPTTLTRALERSDPVLHARLHRALQP